MEQYIKKSALVAEIERKKIPFKKDIDDGVYPTYLCALMDFENFINTLEVKEVDLDEEFDRYCENLYIIDVQNEPYAELFDCAKYFFELGLKAQKGE